MKLDDFELIGTETIPCTIDQWNFPHPRNQPWAKNGECSICGQSVSMIRLEPDRPHTYTCIAEPHTRELKWYKINGDDLGALLYIAGPRKATT